MQVTDKLYDSVISSTPHHYYTK